ncbi:Ubx domain-containing protein [Coemansia umbellata]|uniref:Ubx domain-containing protein n=1 Tax=Coemansia umbellata TaxID=1424467 RepID=A0ABQ8PPQ3_9FUNG|nr:Ubx domain-containing protein [Coemansia umbellata]
MASSEENTGFLLESLSDDEQRQLFEFCEATGIEDLSKAAGVLRSSRWNVGQAIQSFFEPGNENISSGENIVENGLTDASSGLRRRTAGTHSGFLSAVGLRRIAAAGIPEGSGESADDAVQFQRYFESLFGNTHPQFFSGSYARALEAARRELKYLVVVLWSKEHDDSEIFGQALASPQLVDYLNDPRFIVWAGDISRSEASSVAAKLDAAAYPFIALTALKPQPFSSSGSRFRMQIVAKIGGLPSANGLDSLIRDIIRCINGPVELNEQALLAARREQQERETERMLRDQQNAAYEASLARDRERESAAREKEERERAEREEEEKRQREFARMDELRTQWRWATLARLLREEENDAASGELPKGAVGKFNIRLEDGTRVIKAFSANATMRHIFDFIETRQVAKEWEAQKTTPFGDDLQEVQLPEGYTHEYDFALVSQFPRAVFGDTSTVLREAMSAKGLWPSATLIVEPVFEPENNEDKSD